MCCSYWGHKELDMTKYKPHQSGFGRGAQQEALVDAQKDWEIRRNFWCPKFAMSISKEHKFVAVSGIGWRWSSVL